MTSEGEREAANEELQLADEELTAAEQLLTAGLPRIAVSRIYFAAFHAARAMLYVEELEPRTHTGVQQLWNRHLVKTGRYDASTSRLLARLQKFREEADYARDFVVDGEWAREELEAARSLVERVREDIDQRFADDS